MLNWMNTFVEFVASLVVLILFIIIINIISMGNSKSSKKDDCKTSESISTPQSNKPDKEPSSKEKANTSYSTSLKDYRKTSSSTKSNLEAKEFNRGLDSEIKENASLLRSLDYRIASDSKSNLQKTESSTVSVPEIKGNTIDTRSLGQDRITNLNTNLQVKANRVSALKVKRKDSLSTILEKNHIASDSKSYLKKKESDTVFVPEVKENISHCRNLEGDIVSDSTPNVQKKESNIDPRVRDLQKKESKSVTTPEVKGRTNSLEDYAIASDPKSNLPKKESNLPYKVTTPVVKGSSSRPKGLEGYPIASDPKSNLPKKESNKETIADVKAYFSTRSESRPNCLKDYPIASDPKSILPKKESNKVTITDVKGSASRPKDLEDYPIASDPKPNLQKKEPNKMFTPDVKGSASRPKDQEDYAIASDPKSNLPKKGSNLQYKVTTPDVKGNSSRPKGLEDYPIASDPKSNVPKKESNKATITDVKESASRPNCLKDYPIATDPKSILPKKESNKVTITDIKGSASRPKDLEDYPIASDPKPNLQKKEHNKMITPDIKGSLSRLKVLEKYLIVSDPKSILPKKESNKVTIADVKGSASRPKDLEDYPIASDPKSNLPKNESNKMTLDIKGSASLPKDQEDYPIASEPKSNLLNKDFNKMTTPDVEGSASLPKGLEDHPLASDAKSNLPKKDSNKMITPDVKRRASRPKRLKDYPITSSSKSNLQEKESNIVPVPEVEENTCVLRSLEMEDDCIYSDKNSSLPKKEPNRVSVPKVKSNSTQYKNLAGECKAVESPLKLENRSSENINISETKGDFNNLNKNIEDNYKGSKIKSNFTNEEMEIKLSVSEGKGNRNGAGPLMCKLLKKQLYTDVNFFSKGKKAILSAHRAVLAAKCKYFEDALFDAEMMNESVGLEMDLEIKNVPFCIFVNIVKYFYTDYIEFSDDYTVLELYAATKYFEIQPLIDKCEIYIDSIHITENNVCSNLQICNEKNIDPFKSRCIDFIQKNTFQVINSTDFEKCSFITIREICQLPFLNLKSEAEMLEAILRWLNNQPKHTIKELTRALLKCVRFLNFTPKEFTDIIQKHADILTPEESLKILMYLNNPTPKDLYTLPKWCNKSLRTFQADSEKIEKELSQHFYENSRIKISLKPTKENINLSKLTSILHMRCRKGMHQITSLKFAFEDSGNVGSVLADLEVKVLIAPDGPKFMKIFPVQSRESTLTFTKAITVLEGQVLQMEVTAKAKHCIFLSFDKWHNDPNYDFDCFFISEPMTHKLYFISEVEYGPHPNAAR